MIDLIEAMEARLAILEDQIGGLRKQIDPIEAEYARLINALNIMRGDGATIKDIALQIIREAPDGASGIAISAQLRKRGRNIARSSLTPQLSRLKSEGKVSLTDGIWRALS